ncbi:hypothetical protein NL108_012468, partial [Boleophthalmus pectinirostris]
QADMRDGEKVVIADAITPGLLSVTGKPRLLITPHCLRGNHKHQNTKYKQDREPDSPDASGVSVHPANHSVEGSPVHLWFQL